MKRIVLCILAVVSGLAEQPRIPRKPACNSSARGRFWPEAANSDPRLARQLSQCGSLEMCSLGALRYNWRPVAVNVRQLRKAPQAPTPECAALLARVSAD